MTDPVDPTPASDPGSPDLTTLDEAEFMRLVESNGARIQQLKAQAIAEGQATDEQFARALDDPDAQNELSRRRQLHRQLVDEMDRRRKARQRAKTASPEPPSATENTPGLPEGTVREPLTSGPWPTIDAGPDGGSYDDGHRFGWKKRTSGPSPKLIVAGIVAVIAAAFGLTLILSGSSDKHTTAAPPSVTASNPSPMPSTASSPVVGVAPVTITDNEDKFIGGDPCSNGILHLEWDISGGHLGEVVVVQESGPGLPPQRTFKLTADGSFDVDVHTGGNGVYTTQIVSIGGQPPPTANSTNSASVTGCT